MAGSTKTKEPKVKPETNYNEVMLHIADLSERINFAIDAVHNHAGAIESQKTLLERIRVRMGL